MTLAGCLTVLMRVDVRATAALAALALLGNFASIPLFYGVDLVFGSVPVLLAVALLGTRAAVVVAFFGSLYTVFLWGHPWAIPEFVLEALVVGMIYRRGQRNLVLADLTFWLFAAGPIFFPLVSDSVQPGSGHDDDHRAKDVHKRHLQCAHRRLDPVGFQIVLAQRAASRPGRRRHVESVISQPAHGDSVGRRNAHYLRGAHTPRPTRIGARQTPA